MTDSTPTTAAIQGYCGDCNKPTDTLPCPHCSGIVTATERFGVSANTELDEQLRADLTAIKEAEQEARRRG